MNHFFIIVAGTYSCIRLDLQFSREPSSYISQYFVPSIFLVIVAWISSFLNPVKSPIPRTIILTACFLLQFKLSSDSVEEVRNISYETMMHRWNSRIMTFLLFAGMEFIVVICIKTARSEDDKETRDNCWFLEKLKLSQYQDKARNVMNLVAKWMEILQRCLFPLLFLIFLIMFKSRVNILREYGAEGELKSLGFV